PSLAFATMPSNSRDLCIRARSATVPAMQASDWLVEREEGGRLVIQARRQWTIQNAGRVDAALAHLGKAGGGVRFDLSQREELDTAGAWLIPRTVSRLEGAGRQVELIGADSDTARLLDQVAAADRQVPVLHKRHRSPVDIVARLGEVSWFIARDFR